MGLEGCGPVVRGRLVKLVGVLVALLDNFLMPDDLPPIADDGSDDWVRVFGHPHRSWMCCAYLWHLPLRKLISGRI